MKWKKYVCLLVCSSLVSVCPKQDHASGAKLNHTKHKLAHTHTYIFILTWGQCSIQSMCNILGSRIKLKTQRKPTWMSKHTGKYKKTQKPSSYKEACYMMCHLSFFLSIFLSTQQINKYFSSHLLYIVTS